MYFHRVQSDQLYTWSDEYSENQPAAALRKRRKRSLRQLPPLKAILRGSLIERYKRCGKPGCKCADGPGHGPKYYLSVSYPGLRPQMDYVPQESYAQTSRVPGQLPPSPRDPGSDLRDQPRTAAPSRGALKGRHERSCCPPSMRPIDAGLGGVLLANMLEAWLDGNPRLFANCGGSR